MKFKMLTAHMVEAGLVLAALLIPICANADEPKTWNLLQKRADGGIASILGGLTKDQCDYAKNRVEGNPATPEEVVALEAKRNAKILRLYAWEKDHPGICREVISVAPAAQDDVVDNGDGTCLWYQAGEEGRTYGPHDVISAECFQGN